MKVHHDEGVANRIEPEPCGFVREGRSEASVGAHRPAIEPRKALVLDADAVDRAEGDAGRRVTASALLVRRGMCVSSLYQGTGRSRVPSRKRRAVHHNPSMQKSHSAISQHNL